MSGLRSEVDALYNAQVESQNIRQLSYPLAFAGFNLISDATAGAGVWMIDGAGAAYGQVVAAAVIPNPCWLVGLSLGLPVVEAFQADVRIAIGAIGNEVILTQWPCGTNVFIPVEWTFPVLRCNPIKILGSPRVAFDIRKSTGISLAGFNICHILVETGRGT